MLPFSVFECSLIPFVVGFCRYRHPSRFSYTVVTIFYTTVVTSTECFFFTFYMFVLIMICLCMWVLFNHFIYVQKEQHS